MSVSEYKIKVGLEVHVQLCTQSKMFCGCRNAAWEDDPNIYVCPVCLALPGALPVINETAIAMAAKTAMALNFHVNEENNFDRKNYFYPDLPKGYQISQYFFPVAKSGWLQLDDKGMAKKVRINRLHMEEDTAKLLHTGAGSLVDFNRAGVPLMEIVTEPDIESAQEAVSFLKKLHRLVTWLGVSRARMQFGELRCDVNISILDFDGNQMGEVVEIKNLNSFRNVEKAIKYEFGRQKMCVEKGIEIIKETRGWDTVKFETTSQRKKEYAHDYRYFTDPDLPELIIEKDELEQVRKTIPELPGELKERIQQEYNLDDEYINTFVTNTELFAYFELVRSDLDDFQIDFEKNELNNKVASFLVSEFLPKVSTSVNGQGYGGIIKSQDLAYLLYNFYSRRLNNISTREILAESITNGQDIKAKVEEVARSIEQEGDSLPGVIRNILAENQNLVKEYKSGKEQVLAYFIGQVMKVTQGKADPKNVKDMIIKELIK